MNDLSLNQILVIWTELCAVYHVGSDNYEIPAERLYSGVMYDDYPEQCARSASEILQKFASALEVVIKISSDGGNRARIHPNAGRSGAVYPIRSSISIRFEPVNEDER